MPSRSRTGSTRSKNAIDAASLAFDLSHFGITGCCMGGTYALRAACELEGLSAAAPFYRGCPRR
ncbi:MAG: dienelactone hydrolase family protein [Chloracidobacterium sp.]|nr:dienelactone hydrolase family protein [Chloracidobacterium sp.]